MFAKDHVAGPEALINRAQRRFPPTGTPRAVVGVCPGARCLAVAALAGGSGTVAVVPTSQDAEELVAGLAVVAPTLTVVTLPSEAFEGPGGHRPSLGATADAVRALLQISHSPAPILVAPARVLAFSLPRPEAVAARSPSLERGGHVGIEELLADLVAGGYRRVEVVEEAGEFAVRGGILDLGTADGFVRVVLDVDRIESLRPFDPASQRSSGEIDRLVVLPLRLFAADRATRTRLADTLAGIGLDALAAAARDGRDPALWEALLGWSDDTVAAWDLLPGLVVCEPEAVAEEVGRSARALATTAEAAGRNGVRVPTPESWLRDGAAIASALDRADRVAELAVSAGHDAVRLRTRPTPAAAARPQLLLEEIRRGVADRHGQVLVAASPGEEQRLRHLLGEAGLEVGGGWPTSGAIGVVSGLFAHGFVWLDEGVVVWGRRDLTSLPAPSRPRRTLAAVLAGLRDLRAGDFVVHTDHGVGRFAGFVRLPLEDGEHECVELHYAGGGKLLVPLERADLLEKYAGSEGTPARLDRLGGGTWAGTKAKVKRALKDLAEELLKVQAEREAGAGFAFSKDSPWQRDFEAAFEFELTPDQDQAVRDVKRDMEAMRPMDRLLVGDVGYGKTEVAMRAAFKAVLDGKQVAVLAPTTILAEQHFRTFTRRFAGFPVEIRWLSRFLPTAEQRGVVAGLADGTVDIVIGTHRLIAADVRFRDLGLDIIDEEQRFGVAQKERLKKLKAATDVLALSATPIPRSLNLGLLGLRDVSVIETPPRDRLAVQTHVLPFRKEVVREAVLTEMARGGQTFFVHNRIASMAAIAALLREIVPEAQVVMAHGQMDERELERGMDAFLAGEADVLLATAIIENGLDIPNANTLIVNRADRFGLAQLYQLRGRVGRSDRLAFAYLFVPPERSLTEEARQRLAAVVEFAELGAGFRIAARDLEIRGAGNLLGAEQHGHLRAVGYETYCRLLEEAVRDLRGEEAPPPTPAAELRLGLDLRLPESFVADESLRLVLYRRIAAAGSDAEIVELERELGDRFGPPPLQLDNLLLHQRLRRRAEACGITRVRRTATGFDLTFDAAQPTAHATAMTVLAGTPGASLTPAGVLRWPSPHSDPRRGVDELLDRLTP